jgi:glyoxylase-like metal-dependent hydrolase (beta-lactamase superfamily II)
MVRSQEQPAYEVYALRYATLTNRRASDVYLNYETYGLRDRTLSMECYFWLIRNAETVALVDCGFSREAGLAPSRTYDHNPDGDQDPIELLARLGTDTEQVQHVIVSHMHSDHIGNLGLFPNATFSVSRTEYDYWTSALGNQPALRQAVRTEEINEVARLVANERVRFVDGSADHLPGITIAEVGGHSPGQMIVTVPTRNGTVVLASDAVHYQEELKHRRPFYIFTDLVAMFAAYDTLHALADQPRTWVVSGHDPAEMDRFVRVNVDCVDLARPVAAELP